MHTSRHVCNVSQAPPHSIFLSPCLCPPPGPPPPPPAAAFIIGMALVVLGLGVVQVVWARFWWLW